VLSLAAFPLIHLFSLLMPHLLPTLRRRPRIRAHPSTMPTA
jgi:hypothetical protein